MHAIRLHEFGPADNLRWEEVDDPAPGAGEVLVDVTASGVHLLDTSIRRGTAMGPFPLPDLPDDPGPRGRGRRRRGRRRRRRRLGRPARRRAPRPGEPRLRRARGHRRGAPARAARRGEPRCGRRHDRHRPHGAGDPRRRRASPRTTSCSSPAPRAASAPCSSRARCAPARRCSARRAARRRSPASGPSERPGWTTCDRTGTPASEGVTLVLDGVGGEAGTGGARAAGAGRPDRPVRLVVRRAHPADDGGPARAQHHRERRAGPAHHPAAARAGGAGARRRRRGRARARPRRALHARPRRRGPRGAGDAGHGGQGRARAALGSAPMDRAAARDTIKGLLARTGFEVRRRGAGPRRTLPEVLEHVRGQGFAPATVVDVGVATGTPELYVAFPGARLLLVEPLTEYAPALDALRAERGAEVAQVAAGAEPGTLELTVHRVLACSSVVGERSGDEADVTRREVPVAARRRARRGAGAARPLRAEGRRRGVRARRARGRRGDPAADRARAARGLAVPAQRRQPAARRRRLRDARPRLRRLRHLQRPPAPARRRARAGRPRVRPRRRPLPPLARLRDARAGRPPLRRPGGSRRRSASRCAHAASGYRARSRACSSRSMAAGASATSVHV